MTARVGLVAIVSLVAAAVLASLGGVGYAASESRGRANPALDAYTEGYLRICKAGPFGTYTFTIAGSTTVYTVNNEAAHCTDRILLPVGQATVTEAPKPGTTMIGCTAAPDPAALIAGIPATRTCIIAIAPRAGPNLNDPEADYTRDLIFQNLPAPTAVLVRSFTATAARKGVLLRWRTGSEVDTLGFNVYRETQGRRVKLNRSLIASKAPAGVAGASYSFWDRSRRVKQARRYWLQAVNRDGSRLWRGPVKPLARR